MSDWSAGQPPRGRRPQGHGGYDYYQGGAPAGRRPAPPPPGQSGPRPPTAVGGPPPRPPRRRPRWGRRIGITALVLVALLVGLVLYADTTLQRTTALEDYPGRVADTSGTNWLLVGSDSREGMDAEQLAELSAGEAIGGRRTDTMMMLHVPASGGQPALISFPRDSSVPIEGLGRTKLNAAFAEGGPQLLAKTIEQVSGVHIDRYAEIGLGGFAGLVDAVGGVDICLDKPMNDWRAGVNLQPGCQNLNGPQALGFVRARYSLGSDLERAANQRKLLGALVRKATDPMTLLNPFRLVPLVGGAGQTFLVNDGDHVWDLAFLAWAMGGVSGEGGVTAQVPFGDFETTDSGESVIRWDKEKALRMFDAIAKDQPIPPDVLAE